MRHTIAYVACVFSACAEVVLFTHTTRVPTPCILRVCGGSSLKYDLTQAMFTYSPRVRR